MLKGQGKFEVTKQGGNRESNEGRGRFDLLPYESMEALSKWYEEGANKYGERNWEIGLSVKDCINRMIRHAIKAGNGWTDEDHLAAVMWNASTAISLMQRKPECNDHVWRDNPNKESSNQPSSDDSLDTLIGRTCNSLNAQSGVARREGNYGLYEILDQTHILLRTMQERIEAQSLIGGKNE